MHVYILLSKIKQKMTNAVWWEQAVLIATIGIPNAHACDLDQASKNKHANLLMCNCFSLCREKGMYVTGRELRDIIKPAQSDALWVDCMYYDALVSRPTLASCFQLQFKVMNGESLVDCAHSPLYYIYNTAWLHLSMLLSL